jgi:DNA-binding MarR family transcriptional regulator
MPATYRCTCFALRKLTRTVSRLYDLHLAGVGLKTTQYSLLQNLDPTGVAMADLAHKLGTDRTTLTRTLKPLIDAGWVIQTAGTDARRRIVRITAAGQEKRQSAANAWSDAQTELERTLGLDLVDALHRDVGAALHELNPLLEEKLHAAVE